MLTHNTSESVEGCVEKTRPGLLSASDQLMRSGKKRPGQNLPQIAAETRRSSGQVRRAYSGTVTKIRPAPAVPERKNGLEFAKSRSSSASRCHSTTILWATL
jgi:hypothetical protein